MAGQPGADAGAGAGDDGDTAAEEVPCGHRVRSLAAAVGVQCSANGTESSASRTTFIEVNTSPSRAAADTDVDHTAGHVERHEVGDLVDVEVEAHAW